MPDRGALHFRPVDYLPGDFDDRTSRQKAVWGVYATQWLTEKRAAGLDFHCLATTDRMADLISEVGGADRAGLDVFGIGEHHPLGFWILRPQSFSKQRWPGPLKSG